MDVIDLRRDLRMLVGPPGQAYLVRRGGEITLVDTGRSGSGADVAAALADWGEERAALRRVVLTHWHADHAGSAAEIGAWPGVQVYAHRADAPVVRGLVRGTEPVFTPAEQELFARVSADLPDAPPARVDHELVDGDVVPGFGARVIATPGHTDGSIALLLPEAGVLFTGDIAARGEGGVILGPFNTDRAVAARSFRLLAGFELDVVCFGHGEALLGPATAELDAAATAPEVPDPFG